jgi:hypothetical protein
MGRTETDRKITNEPWSSKQSLTEPIRPLFGVNGVVCPKKEKREQKIEKNFLTRAGIVRDVRFPDYTGARRHHEVNCSAGRPKLCGAISFGFVVRRFSLWG